MGSLLLTIGCFKMVESTKYIGKSINNHRSVFKTVKIMWTVSKELNLKIPTVNSNNNTIIALGALFPLKFK